MDFSFELEQKTKATDEIVKRFLPTEASYQKLIIEAMDYALSAGGKRLRPLIMYETYKLFGGGDSIIEPFMAAIEFIHTYSLIHDDLPAMDNDDYRRGKLTTHKVYGEAMGILAGDALLNYAFEIAASAVVEAKNPQNAANALLILTQKAGIYGMIGGQVADVLAENQPQDFMTKDKIEFIYQYKTGALLEASMTIGAMLAGATSEQINITKSIANKVGMAFQIQDDILDITGTIEELGKPIGSDEKNDKVTYVTLYGLDDSAKKVESLSQEAISLLEDLPGDKTFIKALILALIHRRK